MVNSAILDRAYARGMYQHVEEISAFVAFLQRRFPSLDGVLEIGMLKGGTAELWLGISTGFVIGVDLPSGPFGGADHNLSVDACIARNNELSETHGGRFVGILGNSSDPETIAKVKCSIGKGVDLLFIDGDHAYKAVRADFENYRRFVKPGGVIAFHDINHTTFHAHAGVEVPQLWRELVESYSIIGTREFTQHRDWGGIGAVLL